MNNIIGELIENEIDICVSILIPTRYKSFKEKEKVNLMIKNCFHKLEKNLKDNYEKDIYRPLISKANDLINQLDINHPPEGIGIFISKDYEKFYSFNFPIKEKVIISGTFEIQDIIYDLNRLFEYYVLVLNKEKTKLFKGTGNDISEIYDDYFPKSYEDKKKEVANHSNLHKPTPQIEQKYLEMFLKDVYHSAEKYFKNKPLILIGEEKYLKQTKKYFKKYTNNIGNIEHNIRNEEKIYEIIKMIKPILNEYQKHKENDVINLIENSFLNKKVAAGIHSVLENINTGKLNMHLIVEKDFEVSGYLDSKNQLHLEKKEDDYNEIPNVVEHLIEKIFRRKDAKINIVNNKTLKKYESIVLIYDEI
ncbi:MAG: hypothetical protein GY830_05595 [Bacteroidetes bacterium]|nr:hypothetical protein [Bacteroidota bacterium]